MTFALRPFNDENDLSSIFALLARVKDAGYLDIELRSDNLRVILSDPALERGWTALLEDQGRLAGFGILWRGHHLGFCVAPVWRGAAELPLLTWALGRVAMEGGSALFALCRSDDPATRALVESAGFTLHDEELRMRRPLDEPIDEPVVPPGFAIRPLAGFTELPAWIELYDAIFGPGRAPSQRRAATMRDQDYNAALDLVAVDANERLVAMCWTSIAGYEATHCGTIEGRMGPTAVAENYRRIGLGRAIVLSGLRALREHGAQVAMLETDMDNVAAQRVYGAAGYRRGHTACWYAREV